MQIKQKTRIILADDSALLKQVLRNILEQSNMIEVIADAANGKEAIDLVKKLNPDVLILDCEMPLMNGLNTLQNIMKDHPLPVFMFSSLTREGTDITLKALELGAVDFFVKPVNGPKGLQDISHELISKIRHAHINWHLMRLQSKLKETTNQHQKSNTSTSPHNTRSQITINSPYNLIAIASSTGGVQAANYLVQKFDFMIPPIVWVQHMPDSFTTGFANRLNTLSPLTILEAQNNMHLEANHCYIAPGNNHMRIIFKDGQYLTSISGTEKISGHCPSCDALFSSIAEINARRTIGIILTGMGSDGAKGLSQLQKNGAYTIGQSEASCAVYGMPKAANKLGALKKELALNDIPGIIKQLIHNKD